MATKTLVEFPLDAGPSLIEKLEKNGISLMAAYWQFERDEEAWRLVLSSSDVLTKGPRFVVEQVRAALASLTSEIENFGRWYGRVEHETDDRWKIYSRSEPYIYRLLPT